LELPGQRLKPGKTVRPSPTQGDFKHLNRPTKALEISRSLLLTARLDILEDNKALLIPCNGKIPTYLVSLKGCKEARRVRLHELSPPGTVVGNPKGKGQDWLSLLLKERLGELFYHVIQYS
jgi:hypothetical protein